MDPLDYLRAFRQRWRVILVCLLAAVAVTWLTTPAKPPVQVNRGVDYTATATLLRAPDSQTSLGYVSLYVTKGRVPEIVARQIGFKGDPQLLAQTITVTPQADLGTISIAATSNDGSRAARLANSFAEETLTYLKQQKSQDKSARIKSYEQLINDTSKEITDIQSKISAAPHDVVLKAQRQALSTRYQSLFSSLQQEFADVSTTSDFTLLQKATPLPSAAPGTTFSAPRTRSGRLKIAALLGLLLGLVLALLLDRFDTRLRRRDEVQDAMNLPVLAEVPRASRVDGRSMLAMVDDPGGLRAEAYRGLRSALLLLPSAPIMLGDQLPDRSHRAADVPSVLLTVSARGGAGKTTTAANLAVAMSELGKRVLLLDCDFRNPSLHKLLDVPWGPGLSDLWDAEPGELLTLSRPTASPGVRLVTAGNALDRPLALPTKMGGLIHEARGLADIVIIDAAPLLSANEVIDLMPYVDSVLVVARSGRTTRDQAHRTVELLARMRVPVSGVVLNATPMSSHPRGRRTGSNAYPSEGRTVGGELTKLAGRKDNGE